MGFILSNPESTRGRVQSPQRADDDDDNVDVTVNVRAMNSTQAHWPNVSIATGKHYLPLLSSQYIQQINTQCIKLTLRCRYSFLVK